MKVWNVVHKPPAVKLSDIQSEELVQQLREDVAAAPVPEPISVVSTLDHAEVDADLALAIQLQQEFDRERAELEIAKAETRHQKQFSKVLLDSDILRSVSSGPPRPVQRWDADTADACSDDEDSDEEDEEMMDEEEEEEDLEEEDGVANAQGQSNLIWITKHDADICGLRNTEYLEETHPQHNLGNLENIKMSNPVFNNMMSHAERSQSRGVRRKFGKSEHATRDQAIDPKTRLMLFKMMSNGLFSEINGAISTGKEAVVYHAAGSGGEQFAVKIFKTTLTDFKNRSKYVIGEERFRQLGRQNPRKVVHLWAEKEMKNLKRAERAGLRCPAPIALRKHVLVMQLIGTDGDAAPKLTDAKLAGTAGARDAYFQCVDLMRQLYQKCRLVHADLSEFNMLWHEKQLWLIDLAQAVEFDHPNAMRFLRDDCNHVTQYFRWLGVSDVLTVRNLFQFVSQSEVLDLGREMGKPSPTSEQDDNVWFESFLPQRLSDLADPEAAADRVKDAFHKQLLKNDEGEEEEVEEVEEEEEREKDKEKNKEKGKAKKPSKTSRKKKNNKSNK